MTSMSWKACTFGLRPLHATGAVVAQSTVCVNSTNACRCSRIAWSAACSDCSMVAVHNFAHSEVSNHNTNSGKIAFLNRQAVVGEQAGLGPQPEGSLACMGYRKGNIHMKQQGNRLDAVLAVHAAVPPMDSKPPYKLDL